MPLPAHGRASLPRGRWTTLRARAADESGAILALTAITLVAFLGLAALAIDVGSFYQAQRQAQAAADAGALAGADALAGGASAAAASTTATNMASTNYPSTTVPAVTVNGSSVTVNVANTTPAYFGRIFGITKENVGARAVASGTSTTATCTTPGDNCWAIWARDTACTGTNPVSIGGGGYTITGGVHSNGGISTGGGGSKYGPVEYGNTTGCNMSTGGGDTFTSGPTPTASSNTWPIDYSLSYPACSGGACTGPNGTPSFCTYAAASYTFTSTPTTGIYCAYGSGASVKAGDPTTWNGSVTFSNGGYDVTGSFIAGTMSIGSGLKSLTAYNYPTNHMLFYAVGTGTAVTIGGGGFPLVGDVFAPNGTIAVTAGISSTNFLEGNDVSLSAGGLSITGDGPPDSGTTSSSGTAALTQ